MLLVLFQRVSTSNHRFTQKSYYLFVVARAIREQATLDWADVIVLERLQVTQVVWPHKVHHTPVLLQSVLEGVSCQNHSRGSLDLADRNRNFCLEEKKPVKKLRETFGLSIFSLSHSEADVPQHS